MNANELADKLEECAKINFFIDCTYEQYDDDKDIKLEAATMLRQQQSEIEALLKFIDERGETGQLIIWKAQKK